MLVSCSDKYGIVGYISLECVIEIRPAESMYIMPASSSGQLAMVMQYY